MSVATITVTPSNTYNETRELELQLRKRTSSFSTRSTAPPPAKLQRTNMTSSLRRSDSMSVLPSLSSASSSDMSHQQYRVINHYKEQRLRRKAQLAAAGTSTPAPIVTTPTSSQSQPSSTLRRSSSTACLLTIPTAPKRRVAPPPSSNLKPPAKVILPSKDCPITQHLSLRLTSPLSPMPQKNVPILLPSILARSSERRRDQAKANANSNSLYRTAIITHMSSSPEGQKILHMGPRLAMSIINATKELERIVAMQQEREAELDRVEVSRQERLRERERAADDFDYVMAEAPLVMAPISLSPPGNSLATPVLTTRPWVQDDWEMIECAA